MNKDKIAILGLGYVGLPLARLFATKYYVVGFDINTKKISELMSGVDSALEVNNKILKSILIDEDSNEIRLFHSHDLDKIKDFCNILEVKIQMGIQIFINWYKSYHC